MWPTEGTSSDSFAGKVPVGVQVAAPEAVVGHPLEKSVRVALRGRRARAELRRRPRPAAHAHLSAEPSRLIGAVASARL